MINKIKKRYIKLGDLDKTYYCVSMDRDYILQTESTFHKTTNLTVSSHICL